MREIIALKLATDLPADVESKDDFKCIPDRENYDRNFNDSLRKIIPIVIDTLVDFQKVLLASHS